jgi:hypothetical protein
MSHVVLQAASFPTPAEAQRAEEELQKLFDAYVAFESSDPEPWRQDRVPPPLVDFGRAHGVEWPLRDDARFLLKGAFAEAAQLMRVDRLVFFWGGGFELGGTTLRAILAKLGASVTTDRCDIGVRCAEPDDRVRELVEFLEDEDFEDQFTLDDEDADPLHRLRIVGPSHERALTFDDSGVEDWAFVALLPQLDGEDPVLQGL